VTVVTEAAVESEEVEREEEVSEEAREGWCRVRTRWRSNRDDDEDDDSEGFSARVSTLLLLLLLLLPPRRFAVLPVGAVAVVPVATVPVVFVEIGDVVPPPSLSFRVPINHEGVHPRGLSGLDSLIA